LLSVLFLILLYTNFIMNELLFIVQSILLALITLFALYCGKQTVITVIALQAVLANFFVTKQITLIGFTATAADPFIIGCALSLNILQEYFDKKAAVQAVWNTFFALIFYTLFSQIHLCYLPAATDTMNPHFCALLECMPRITFASLAVYFFVSRIDILLYAWLKKILPTSSLVTRNYMTLATTQLVDTILFSFLGLYGLVSNLWHIIFISYLIKCISIVISTPFIQLSRKIIPQGN